MAHVQGLFLFATFKLDSTNLFTTWFHHFVEHVKPSKDDSDVKVSDGHSTHRRNSDVINIAGEKCVTNSKLLKKSLQIRKLKLNFEDMNTI